MGLYHAPQQAVGQTIIWANNHVHIVGVLADAKFDGAREPAKASVYVYDPKVPAYAMIRLRPDAVPQAAAFIDRAWHDFAPTKAVWRYFLDDDFSKAPCIRPTRRPGAKCSAYLLILVAIFISCLGLFGLAALAASRRTKEIGIRKVFGAHASDVVILLLWQFSIPVLIANAESPGP